MPISRYNRAFINQFRQDQIVYPATDDRPIEHLSFHPISGNKQDLEVLAKHLTNIIHDVPLINRLIQIIQNEAIPTAKQLTEYIQAVKIMLTGYANIEPYAATYFNSLVLTLSDLAEQAETFQEDTNAHLLNKLRSPFVSEQAIYNCLDIDTDTIRKIDDVIEYYMDKIVAYDNYFNSLIDQEESQEKGVIVASQVAYYLSKLVYFTDAFIMYLQTSREILSEWEKRLNDREYQELYN